MAEVFGNDSNLRGCFSVFHIGPQSGNGARLRVHGSPIPGQFSDPLIVTGVELHQREIVTVDRSIGGRTFVNAFGHDGSASSARISFVGMLGSEGRAEADNIVRTAYGGGRVSIDGREAMLYLGNGHPVRGLIAGMASSTANPAESIQNYSISMIIPEAQ